MRVFAHIATVLVALGLAVGLPAALWANVPALAARLGLGGSVDAVSAATAIQAAPNGHFTIVINKNLHTDEEVLLLWQDFFAGRDVPLIFEDVSCVVLEGDAAGAEMAESLQSRLPANQMKLRTENATLALSKADAGIFDVLVMSDEAAESYGAATVCGQPFAVVVHR